MIGPKWRDSSCLSLYAVQFCRLMGGEGRIGNTRYIKGYFYCFAVEMLLEKTILHLMVGMEEHSVVKQIIWWVGSKVSNTLKVTLSTCNQCRYLISFQTLLSWVMNASKVCSNMLKA